MNGQLYFDRKSRTVCLHQIFVHWRIVSIISRRISSSHCRTQGSLQKLTHLHIAELPHMCWPSRCKILYTYLCFCILRLLCLMHNIMWESAANITILRGRFRDKVFNLLFTYRSHAPFSCTNLQTSLVFIFLYLPSDKWW